MMKPAFTLVLAATLVAACAPATLAPTKGAPTAAPTEVPTQGHLPQVDWLAYHDDTAGFSIQMPLTWRRDEGTGYPVVFALPSAPGTTLLEKRMEINVTPNARECKESTYEGAAGTISPQGVSVNGVNFIREAGSGIAAGNLYDWTAYSTLRGTTCITITFVLHSASSGVYGTEPAPFDRATELQIFGQLLNTFRFDP